MAKHWRKANVTPVFKKGNKEDPGYYRLVISPGDRSPTQGFLTSIPGKVTEQLILETIYRHLRIRKSPGAWLHQEEVMTDQLDKLL